MCAAVALDKRGQYKRNNATTRAKDYPYDATTRVKDYPYDATTRAKDYPYDATTRAKDYPYCRPLHRITKDNHRDDDEGKRANVQKEAALYASVVW